MPERREAAPRQVGTEKEEAESKKDMCSWWYLSAFRWPELGISLPSSWMFRWPGFNLSYLTSGLSLESFRRFDFSVDDVLWTFVTMLESVALVTMLCYFFICCGCTL